VVTDDGAFIVQVRGYQDLVELNVIIRPGESWREKVRDLVKECTDDMQAAALNSDYWANRMNALLNAPKIAAVR
jgi:hypothetical protein